MKKTLLALCGVLAATYAAARPQGQILTWYSGTNETYDISVTNSAVQGYVYSVDVSLSGGTATATSALYAVPINTLWARATLATGTVTQAASVSVRPLFDGTDNTGSALTSDPPKPAMVFGETLVWRIWASAQATGLTYKAWIKYDNGN